MILANTTSIGMQPKVDETPVPKVISRIFYCHLYLCIYDRKKCLTNGVD